MGVDVPIISGVSKEAGPVVNYKSVGTSIDVQAMVVEGGRFQLELGVQESSVFQDDETKTRQGSGASAGIASDRPMFRSFNSSANILLRDGETGQYTTATDPVTGQVLKIDVTLNVHK